MFFFSLRDLRQVYFNRSRKTQRKEIKAKICYNRSDKNSRAGRDQTRHVEIEILRDPRREMRIISQKPWCSLKRTDGGTGYAPLRILYI